MAHLQLQGSVLSRLIALTAFAAGDSDDRYLTTCVRFRGVQGRRGTLIEAAAFDRWCLAVARGPGEGSGELTFPAEPLAQLSPSFDLEDTFTIRASNGRVQVLAGTRPCADEPQREGVFLDYDGILAQTQEPTAVVSTSNARLAMREVVQRAVYAEFISRDGSLTLVAGKRSVLMASHREHHAPKHPGDGATRVHARNLARVFARCGDGDVTLYLARNTLLLKGPDFDFLLPSVPDPDREKTERAEQALREPGNAGLSDRRLAELAGVSHTHIARVRNQLLLPASTTRTACRRGKTYRIETARIGR